MATQGQGVNAASLDPVILHPASSADVERRLANDENRATAKDDEPQAPLPQEHLPEENVPALKPFRIAPGKLIAY